MEVYFDCCNRTCNYGAFPLLTRTLRILKLDILFYRKKLKKLKGKSLKSDSKQNFKETKTDDLGTKSKHFIGRPVHQKTNQKLSEKKNGPKYSKKGKKQKTILSNQNLDI